MTNIEEGIDAVLGSGLFNLHYTMNIDGVPIHRELLRVPMGEVVAAEMAAPDGSITAWVCEPC